MAYLMLFAIFSLTVILGWFTQQWLFKRFTQYETDFKTQANEKLAELFLFLDPSQVWVASLILSCITGGLVFLVSRLTLLAIVLCLITLIVPHFIVRHIKQKRLRKIEQQLPDLLLALASALRAGSGIQSALRHISSYCPAPLAQELSLMQREQRIGVSFDQALIAFYNRVPTESTSLVVSALRISMQSGGTLAETLERIADTLRSRLYLLGRVRALTAQGRMQAWVMAALPVALALVLYVIDPDSIALLWTTTAGWAVIILIIVLEGIGLFFIRKIVNIVV